MKIKAIIIEDEMPARKTLNSYLKRYFPQVEITGEALDLESGAALLENGSYDFVFLDVQLKDGLGIDLIKNRKDLRVIFTTAFDQYTAEAFKSKAFGYLLKPLDPNDFKDIVNRVIKDVLVTNTQLVKLKIATKNGYAYIETTSIVRCEAESNYSRVFTSDEKSYMLSKSLKYLETELRETGKFVRVHQSHLVNVHFVDQKKMEANFITLTTGEKIPVSRARKEDLNQLLKRVS